MGKNPSMIFRNLNLFSWIWLENLQKKHPDQMFKPPQLVPFNAKGLN